MPPVQVKVAGQYIKDLSFENPNIGKLLKEPGDAPNLQLAINVNAQGVGPNLYESSIDFNAQATNQHGMIYELEIVYAGLFQIQNIPEQALEPFLLVNCPSILFPVLAPDRRRHLARGRLPAAAARPVRLRRALHAPPAGARAAKTASPRPAKN